MENGLFKILCLILKSNACPFCKEEAKQVRLEKQRIKHEKKFYEEALKTWGEGKFDYSKSEYINTITPLSIRCIEHDYWFRQLPGCHKKGKTACNRCSQAGKKEKIKTLFMTLFKNMAKESMIIHS